MTELRWDVRSVIHTPSSLRVSSFVIWELAVTVQTRPVFRLELRRGQFECFGLPFDRLAKITDLCVSGSQRVEGSEVRPVGKSTGPDCVDDRLVSVADVEHDAAVKVCLGAASQRTSLTRRNAL